MMLFCWIKTAHVGFNNKNDETWSLYFICLYIAVAIMLVQRILGHTQMFGKLDLMSLRLRLPGQFDRAYA